MMVVAALVCLLIVTSIVGSMLHGVVRARRQLIAERDRRQTELLLEAGANRAAARLAAEPSFRGDAWTLTAEEIAGLGDARITTQIESGSDNNDLQLHVVAEYPLGRDFPIRRSRTFPIARPTQAQE
jgi:hypothetical protein